MGLAVLRSINLLSEEWSELKRLLDDSNKPLRRLVFYSEKDIYYQYFRGLMGAILDGSDLDICYITSDPDDPLRRTKNGRIKTFYLDKLLPLAISRLDSKALVMTMTDLGRFHIKRGGPGIDHIYIFHAVVSAHLQYRPGAFDNYDTIFCVGPHHVEELRETEELYRLKPKRLIPAGYGRLEDIYRDHQAFLQKHAGKAGNRKKILIAPTWGDQCILRTCIDDIVLILGASGHDVVIRPHPEFVKRDAKAVADIRHKIRDAKNFSLELELLSDESLHEADVLITDRSGIAFEYAFGTERPVLFIDTPPKITNPEFRRLKAVPIEDKLRDTIGLRIGMDSIGGIEGAVTRLLGERDIYAQKIRDARDKYIFNWMNSSKTGADYLIERCGGKRGHG